MFIKLRNWLQSRKQVDTNLQETITQIQYNRLRDKAIEYCTQYDCISNTIELPPSHKVDCILPDMVRTQADLQRYTKRFPYRELIRRLDECYSY